MIEQLIKDILEVEPDGELYLWNVQGNDGWFARLRYRWIVYSFREEIVTSSDTPEKALSKLVEEL